MGPPMGGATRTPGCGRPATPRAATLLKADALGRSRRRRRPRVGAEKDDIECWTVSREERVARPSWTALERGNRGLHGRLGSPDAARGILARRRRTHARHGYGRRTRAGRRRSRPPLEGDDHGSLLCTYWLVECLARCGEPERATELFERATSCANDPAAGELWGNFPTPTSTA